MRSVVPTPGLEPETGSNEELVNLIRRIASGVVQSMLDGNVSDARRFLIALAGNK